MLKTLEICVFGTQESEKNGLGPFFDGPSTLPRAPRAATLRSKVTFGRPKSLFGAPRDPPGTPKAPPGPPPTTSKNFNLPSSELKIDDFQILHVFPTFFKQFSVTQITLQNHPSQLLHIFPTDFNKFTNRAHQPDPPRTPPGTSSGPLWTPPGPPQDPPKELLRYEFDPGNRTTKIHKKKCVGERAAHPAGTEPPTFKEKCAGVGERVAHSAGTEPPK